MNQMNRHLAQYGDLTWDDVRPDEDDSWVREPPQDDIVDDLPPASDSVGCAVGDHEYEEATGYPEYSGRCAVYSVCTVCGHEGPQHGWDSVI